MLTYLLPIFIYFESWGRNQKVFFQIKVVETGQITEIRRGNFVQCIQKSPSGNETFVFGEVMMIRHDGILLRQNTLIKGSSGFVYYDDIVNIERIRVFRRSILPACVTGILLGEMMIIDQIPRVIISPIGVVATFFIIVGAVKRKRKSLSRNRVPDAIVLITPVATTPNDRYFEPSSSRNQPE